MQNKIEIIDSCLRYSISIDSIYSIHSIALQTDDHYKKYLRC